MSRIRPHLDLYASARFLKAYRKASPRLQYLAEGAIHDLINLFRSNPRTVSHYYDQIAHCKTRILEIDISAGHRLLAHYSKNCLIMLDVGIHEIVSRYSDGKYESDIRSINEAPNQFWPEQQSEFFISYPDKSITLKYKDEVSSEWLYFLEDTQEKIFWDIVNEVANNQHSSAFVVGGPGTGKTCILVNLLKLFADSEYDVGIVLSDSLTQYIEASTEANISKYRVSLGAISSLDLLLIDDPTHYNLMRALTLKKTSSIKAIVAAFDPLQLDKAISDQEFEKLVETNKVAVHTLGECYRQKENVGKATKRIVDIVAASTPFLAENKIQRFQEKHKSLTSLANDLEFLNPHGYTEVYPHATVDNIRYEVKRILSSKQLMWQHWPGLLILLDGCELTDEAMTALRPLIQRNYVKILLFDKANEVKGLEFQHVFIFINKDLYEEIQTGFKGTGQSIYNQRRLLRIPFSRAKDSLVIFAIENV